MLSFLRNVLTAPGQPGAVFNLLLFCSEVGMGPPRDYFDTTGFSESAQGLLPAPNAPATQNF